MKKVIKLCSIIVVLLLIGMISIAASGKMVNNQKINLFHVSGGTSDNVQYDQPFEGHVIIVDPMGSNDVILNGVIKGLSPNMEYFVWVRNLTGYTGDYLYSYPSLGYYKLTSFMTNVKGKGSFHIHINDSDLPDETYEIQVAINDETGTNDEIGVTVAATQWNPGVTVTVKTAE